MRAETFAPGRRDSLALEHVAEPRQADGSVLVRSLRFPASFPDLEPDIVLECTGAPRIVAQALCIEPFRRRKDGASP